MKRKYENIALLIFVINVIIVIVGILFVQQLMSFSDRAISMDKLVRVVRTQGYLIILFFVLGAIVSSGILIVSRYISKLWMEEQEKSSEIENNNAFIKEQLVKEEKSKTNVFINKKNSVTENLKNISSTSLPEYCSQVLVAISSEFDISQGIFHLVKQNDEGEKVLEFGGGYAYYKEEDKVLKFGEGLAGQVAKAKRVVNIKHIPAGYIKIISGLGESTPTNLLICPLIKEEQTIAVIELASFVEFSKEIEDFFLSLSPIIQEGMENLKNIKL